MNTLKRYWWVGLAVAVLVFPSCIEGDPARARVRAVGVTQCNPLDSTEWWFMADDFTTFVSREITSYTPPRNCRTLAIMDLTDQKRPGYGYVVDFVTLSKVVNNPIIATSTASIDTFTNDAIIVNDAYIALQYLNLSISVYGYDGTLHTFSLLRDSLQTNQPIMLSLRHNAHKDTQYDEISGIISFDLETLAERKTQDSVRIRLITPEYNTMEYTYKFIK